MGADVEYAAGAQESQRAILQMQIMQRRDGVLRDCSALGITPAQLQAYLDGEATRKQELEIAKSTCRLVGHDYGEQNLGYAMKRCLRCGNVDMPDAGTLDVKRMEILRDMLAQRAVDQNAAIQNSAIQAGVSNFYGPKGLKGLNDVF